MKDVFFFQSRTQITHVYLVRFDESFEKYPTILCLLHFFSLSPCWFCIYLSIGTVAAAAVVVNIATKTNAYSATQFRFSLFYVTFFSLLLLLLSSLSRNCECHSRAMAC